MKLKLVVVDFEIPPRVRRAMLLVLFVVVCAGAVPYTFTTGDVLSSKAVNANFDDLDKRIGAGRFVTTNDAGVSYSTGLTVYCGATAAVNGAITSGAKTGYAAAKAQCESVPGCSPSAHMCETSEVVRSAQLGVSIAPGWISTGVNNAAQSGISPVGDCLGWTIGDGTQQAVTWASTFPGWTPCNMPNKIVCCD
jgi:hypothetical protein